MLCRVVHNKNNPYLIVNRTIALDERLSWKAKGIWFYAFSCKDDWKFYFNDLQKRSTDGRESLRAGLKELEEAGYLERKPTRCEKTGKMNGQEWFFYETPRKTNKKTPKDVKPVTRTRSHAENRPLINNRSKQVIKEKRASEPSVRLSLLLFSKIKENHPKQLKPNINDWAKEIDRMMRIDKRTEQEIETIIDWAFKGDFWGGNIQSARSLRRNYDKMFGQMKNEKKSPAKMKEEEDARKQELVKKNASLAKKFLKNKTFDDVHNRIILSDYSVQVAYNNRYYHIGFAEADFENRLESAYKELKRE